MDKKKFEKIMDSWAAQEMEAAPDLEPTPEVYQKLEERKRRSRFSLFSWPIRLAAAGIAAALIILVIVLQPPKEVEPLLGLRKEAVAEKPSEEESIDRMQVLGEEKAEEQAEVEEKEEKAGKAERAWMQEKIEQKAKDEAKKEGAEKLEHEKLPAKTTVARKTQEMEETEETDKEAMVRSRANETRPRGKITTIAAAAAPAKAVYERMEFQFQPKGSGAFEKRDIKAPQEESLYLSTEDNYRLLLQLPQERYVYVFQVVESGRVVRLFPNAAYSPSHNPLHAGKTIIIPPPPEWFYAARDSGEISVHVVTSAEPLINWDNRDAEEKITGTVWLDEIEKAKQVAESQVLVRVFKFTVR